MSQSRSWVGDHWVGWSDVRWPETNCPADSHYSRPEAWPSRANPLHCGWPRPRHSHGAHAKGVACPSRSQQFRAWRVPPLPPPQHRWRRHRQQQRARVWTIPSAAARRQWCHLQGLHPRTSTHPGQSLRPRPRQTRSTAGGTGPACETRATATRPWPATGRGRRACHQTRSCPQMRKRMAPHRHLGGRGCCCCCCCFLGGR